MSKSSCVTIVSGLPRSGTSMMMKMLEAGGLTALTDRLREADTDNPNGYYEFEPVKQTAEDASWLERVDGKVVKMVYSLLRDLPSDREYRVVFMRRDMQEVLDSQRKMLERSQQVSDISDETLAALFARELEAFDKWSQAQPNFAFLQVSYNELLKDCGSAVSQINQFLGGKLDTRAMQEVVDPELYRNRAA